MAMPKSSVRIFDFMDFREYLARFNQEAKAKDRRFSHRFVMLKVGAASAGWFSDLLKARLNLTGTHLLGLVRLLSLSSAEADYFETMVNYCPAASFEDKSRYLEKLLSFKEVRTDLIGRDKLEYYGKWHHAVIRELLFIHDFRGDYKALGRKLNPPVSPNQARQSIKLLMRLQLVQEERDGHIRPVTPVLKKDSSFKSHHLASFLRANMVLGMDALDRVDVQERDISSLGLALSEADFAMAREEIKTLRKKLLVWSEKASEGSKVYQCNFQIFPVTK